MFVVKSIIICFILYKMIKFGFLGHYNIFKIVIKGYNIELIYLNRKGKLKNCDNSLTVVDFNTKNELTSIQSIDHAYPTMDLVRISIGKCTLDWCVNKLLYSYF